MQFLFWEILSSSTFPILITSSCKIGTPPTHKSLRVLFQRLSVTDYDEMLLSKKNPIRPCQLLRLKPVPGKFPGKIR